MSTAEVFPGGAAIDADAGASGMFSPGASGSGVGANMDNPSDAIVARNAAQMDQGATIGHRTRPTPHYQVPSLNAILPDYTNRETDLIQQAFSRTSFVSVRDLPTTFRPSATARAMAAKMNNNRRRVDNVGARDAAAARNTTLARDGVFSTFDYIPSRYSLADELKTKDRLESEARMLDVGGKDWAPSGLPKRKKYEDIFENPEYRFPYMGDAFEAAADQKLRSKWIENAKVLHGPFVPTSKKAPLGKPTRAMMPDLVREIHGVIAEDWGDHTFEVMCTEDDHVAVRFLLTDVRSGRGLAAYMNVMAATNHVVSKYQLSKVVEDWVSRFFGLCFVSGVCGSSVLALLL